jgi:hypothetical protein
MRLYFELSPREIEMQMQPIIAIPIISRGEPNTEPVPRLKVKSRSGISRFLDSAIRAGFQKAEPLIGGIRKAEHGGQAWDYQHLPALAYSLRQAGFLMPTRRVPSGRHPFGIGALHKWLGRNELHEK